MFRILVSNHTAAVEADGARRGWLFPTASTGVTLAGAFAVLSFCLVFMLPWWNRYLGLTNEGWFQLFGLQILRGLVPYRDGCMISAVFEPKVRFRVKGIPARL